MKAALIQLEIVWENRQRNYDRAEQFIRQAAQNACDLVVLPEMFATGFSMKIEGIAEQPDGETSAFLSAAANAHHINIIGGFALKNPHEAIARNVAAVYARDGKQVALFTKLHPFSLTQEERFFMPGERPVIFHLDGIPASVFVCYDLRFPEAFRSVAAQVQMMAVIANWPASRQMHWERLLLARAIENQCFVIGVNRIGADGSGLRHSGGSLVFDPFGNPVTLRQESEELLFAEFSLEDVQKIRSKFPFLQDIRPLSM